MPIHDIVQKLKKEYEHARKKADQEFTFESESDSITLDIPTENERLSINGSRWKFIPFIHPEVALNYGDHNNSNYYCQQINYVDNQSANGWI